MFSVKQGKKYRVTFECVATETNVVTDGHLGSIFPTNARDVTDVEEIKEPIKDGEFYRRNYDDFTYLVLPSQNKYILVRAAKSPHAQIGKVFTDLDDAIFLGPNFEKVENPFD